MGGKDECSLFTVHLQNGRIDCSQCFENTKLDRLDFPCKNTFCHIECNLLQNSQTCGKVLTFSVREACEMDFPKGERKRLEFMLRLKYIFQLRQMMAIDKNEWNREQRQKFTSK